MINPCLGMRAILTTDLLNKGYSVLKISSCAEMLMHLPKIYQFIQSKGIEAKLTSDFYRASITLRGETLDEHLGSIQIFIEREEWMNKD
jgi:hypothetical protein